MVDEAKLHHKAEVETLNTRLADQQKALETAQDTVEALQGKLSNTEQGKAQRRRNPTSRPWRPSG